VEAAVALDMLVQQIQEQMVGQDQLEILVDHLLVVAILVLVQFQQLILETKVPKDGQIQVEVPVVVRHLVLIHQIILAFLVQEVDLDLFLLLTQHKTLS
tara:strand:+ start:311 stop:607 length:297 start_codon:yes stop_codon:yes gene_type:complete